MITIKDLAKAAGVSVTTVSRALNGYSDVNEKTRQKIKKLAQELGYRPNALAQSLVLKKTRTIGVIMSHIRKSEAKDSFAFEVLCGINDRVSELNYEILLFSTNPNKQLNKSYIDLCRERNVDGVILQGLGLSDPYMKEVVSQTNFPSVLIDIPLSGERVGHVTSDNVSGSREAVRHLVELGHRHIIMINGYDEASVSRERLNGYILALQEAGIPYDPSYVYDGNFDEEGGGQCMLRALEEHPQATAVFCASDLMAIGAIEALKRIGKSVPGDVSVVGFDDIPISSYFTPKLTTVRQDKYSLGYQAAQMIVDMLEGMQVKHKVVLSTSLVIRESTGGFQ